MVKTKARARPARAGTAKGSARPLFSDWDPPRVTGVLVLADGTMIEGQGFGAEGEAVGEVCFNTAMTGYQEILTDPSYAGQIVTMTYPEIGNYGVNDDDLESAGPHLAGFVVRNHSGVASNFRSRPSASGTISS